MVSSVVLSGCVEEPICEALGKCGGELEGRWLSAGSCLDDSHRPQPPSSIRNQPTTPAGEVPPELSTTDWCSNLVFENDGRIRRVVPWRPVLPVAEATLIYTRGDAAFAAGRFDFAVRYAGTPTVEFSARCLTEHGTNLSCAALGPALEENQLVDADITNFQCVDREQGGCKCSYDVQSFGGNAGTWEALGGEVTHFADLRSPVSKADFCVQGDELELSGHAMTTLFNQTGLRSMVFRREQ
jgi:hypothetical protein